MAERSIATDCKSVALTGYLGSNPGPSTNLETLLRYEETKKQNVDNDDVQKLLKFLGINAHLI